MWSVQGSVEKLDHTAWLSTVNGLEAFPETATVTGVTAALRPNNT